jgi:hypothetical protein
LDRLFFFAASLVVLLVVTTAEAQSPYVVRASSEMAEYGDTDHVFITTPSISGSIAKPTAGWTVNGSYLVDVVSAASVDIVSTASRRWTEVRQAGALDATYKPGTFGVTVSGGVSDEPDYLSLSAGAIFTQDLMDKNLTLLAGYGHARDVAGRTGTSFSVFSHTIQTDSVQAGATLVLDRRTVGSAVVDGAFVNGDTSKPYRYIPLFAPGTYVPVGASIDLVNALRVSERPLEQVPTTRNRYAVTLRLAHRFHSSTTRLEMRLYDDTWGQLAETTDARQIFDVSRRIELGPHLRLNDQSAVNFWQRAYTFGPGYNYPTYRTGDRELGPLASFTVGGAGRWGIGPALEPMKWSLGLDVEATYSRFLDDLYLTSRTSVLGALSITGEL